MGKCQFVDCRENGEYTELWRVGEARAFVLMCARHSIADKGGTRTSIENGRINRTSGKAEREVVDAQ